jgi:hypothetical protein
MHHYAGKFSLLTTAQGGRKMPLFSGYRCPCKIGGDFFDCSIELINQTELKPGDTASAEIVFRVINLVSSRIQLGCSYELCEGSKPIGTFLIETDLWSKIDNIIRKGEERFGIIQNTNWTIARLELDGGITVHLSSKNVGLQQWAEIAEMFKSGDRVKVKVEKVDKQNRSIEVSFIEKAG